MDYRPRIPADPSYLQALGRAVYNFAYLEWVVVWTIVRLSEDGFGSVPKRESSGPICSALARTISKTEPPLERDLRLRLVRFEEAFRGAIGTRNMLIHAHPYTALGGAQQLGGGGLEWPLADLKGAAKLFEDLAIEGNDIFHGALAEARP